MKTTSHLFASILVLFFSHSVSAQMESKELPFDKTIHVGEHVEIGVIEPPQRDPRIFEPKEVIEHRESPGGSDVFGVKIDF